MSTFLDRPKRSSKKHSSYKTTINIPAALIVSSIQFIPAIFMVVSLDLFIGFFSVLDILHGASPKQSDIILFAMLILFGITSFFAELGRILFERIEVKGDKLIIGNFKKAEFDLKDLHSITCSQTRWGHLLNYGTVTVTLQSELNDSTFRPKIDYSVKFIQSPEYTIKKLNTFQAGNI